MFSREALYKLSKDRTALLIGQIFALLICIGYFNYFYYINIYPDQQVRENFVPSECLIVSKNLSSKSGFIRKYRANFLVTYNYNGVQYNRWVSGNGLDMSYISNRGEQENLLAQFNEGGTYECWVNPEEPDTSVLVLRQHWLLTTPLILPSVISIIVLYYLLMNASTMLALRRDEKRDKKSR